jgi:hypothetical protein
LGALPATEERSNSSTFGVSSHRPCFFALRLFFGQIESASFEVHGFHAQVQQFTQAPPVGVEKMDKSFHPFFAPWSSGYLCQSFELPVFQESFSLVIFSGSGDGRPVPGFEELCLLTLVVNLAQQGKLTVDGGQGRTVLQTLGLVVAYHEVGDASRRQTPEKFLKVPIAPTTLIPAPTGSCEGSLISRATLAVGILWKILVQSFYMMLIQIGGLNGASVGSVPRFALAYFQNAIGELGLGLDPVCCFCRFPNSLAFAVVILQGPERAAFLPEEASVTARPATNPLWFSPALRDFFAGFFSLSICSLLSGSRPWGKRVA